MTITTGTKHCESGTWNFSQIFHVSIESKVAVFSPASPGHYQEAGLETAATTQSGMHLDAGTTGDLPCYNNMSAPDMGILTTILTTRSNAHRNHFLNYSLLYILVT